MSITFPPRGSWARLPTPVHKLESLSKELGIELFVKRDDQTGFEVSGNKIRKLDYLAQDALNKGATCLVTCGGVQSNHCRATAALAARLGLRCVLLLRGESPHTPASNNLLDRLFGAEIFYLTSEQYYEGMNDFRQVLEEQVRAQGGKTYFIPEGGSNGLGTFGYASAFEEVEGQRARGEIPGYDATKPFDTMITAHGSGGTQAGLILGKLGAGEAGESTRIVGINVCYDGKESFRLVKDALWQCIQQYRLPLSFAAIDIEVKEGALGRGYGLSTPEELKFIAKVARTEGMLVDPVYTGKALFGLYRAVKENRAAFGERVLFWHTGGAFGLFKMGEEWAAAL
ncbi:MAG: D-cysteine desulfhydrase family protein [Proteobacteria bacterium]|nr:MAG: D-cysteine desulfhydrase family protein [Pseudomonadota bacterium]